MRSLKQLTRIIYNIADAHLQVNTVVTGEQFEREDHDLYPLVHIVPGAFNISGKTITNRFLLIVLDLGSEDGTHREENLSDCQLIACDILTQLYHDGADLTPHIDWVAKGDAIKIVDGEGDNASGWILEIEAIQTYEKNECEIPN